ncbi:MAG: aminodeoxychorismate/anthranilate synthase component II [bacterium]|nr:aminodeoxychorismate/anthranilate synthase component II [bacterium]
MKQVVVIDNFDSFTFNLVDYLKQCDVNVMVYRNTVDFNIIEDLQPDLIVLSPGPGNPQQAGKLIDYIKHFSEQVPIFGVCLGMQAITEAFGGSLRLLDQPKHGKSSLIEHDGKSIFAGITNPAEVGRYHSLAVDLMPDDFEISASTKDGKDEVVMAMRHNTLPIEGVQFHPESVLSFKQQVGLKMIQNLIAQL